MSRRRTPLLLAAAAAGGAALALGAPRALERRWAGAPDPTGGRPLVLPDGEELTVDALDGGSLAVLACGPPDAPVVLLGHGWTEDRRVWGPVAQRLVAGGLRVVVYDQRGHGRSSAGAAGHTIDAIGDDVAAIVRHLDLREAVLAGHSMGGMALQSFAGRHPELLAERARHLVLVSTAAGNLVRAFPGFNRVALAALTHPVAHRVAAAPRFGRILVRGAHGERPALSHLAATQEMYVGTPALTRGEFFTAMGTMDLTAGLARISVPTTVVVGSRDQLTPRRHSEVLASSIPGARLEVIRGAGHQLPFEAPDRLANILAGDPP
ncbi:MAG: alpha/beta fold hydrolase [Acidimicrobiales bacterium]